MTLGVICVPVVVLLSILQILTTKSPNSNGKEQTVDRGHEESVAMEAYHTVWASGEGRNREGRGVQTAGGQRCGFSLSDVLHAI